MHGPEDQAGASNYVTAEKILAALQIPRTGQTYELGHMYETFMPQFGYRPYFLQVLPAQPPATAGGGVTQRDYFTGFIGQMGTQFDALGHQGETVLMADGTLQNVYYNGFMQHELTGTNRGLHGLEALGRDGIPLLENMELREIAGDQVYEFLFLALTERIKGATGSPVRPIAVR